MTNFLAFSQQNADRSGDQNVEAAKGQEMICEPNGPCDDLTFTYEQQIERCCNTTIPVVDNCACVDFTVVGVYDLNCQSTLVDVWFESTYLCSQGTWSGDGPVLPVELDVITPCGGGCSGSVNIPVTMRWEYVCNGVSYYGVYSRTVTMTIC